MVGMELFGVVEWITARSQHHARTQSGARLSVEETFARLVEKSGEVESKGSGDVREIDRKGFRRNKALTIGFMLLLAGSFAMAQSVAPGGRDRSKVQALILTGYNMHDWRRTTEALRAMLERTGRFEVRVNEEPAGSDATTFSGYDLIILNYTNLLNYGPTWPESTRQAFLDFVRSGKGVVAYHASCGSFSDWPEYDRILSATRRGSGSPHAPYHTFEVMFRDREHPVTKGLPASFRQSDEIFPGVYPELAKQPEVRVLATALDDAENCYAGRKRCGSGKDEPVIWTLQYGKGRVFHTILGHDLKSVATPGFTAIFQRGAEWAATGKVTIEVPPELRQP